MKCLILAAGYGTRMQGVIGDRPKALVELMDKTLLDHLVQQIHSLDLDITLVTNQHFFAQFEQWSSTSDVPVQILNDGSTSAEDRLGAVADMAFAIDASAFDDDLLVLAADNYLPFSLKGMIELFHEHRDITLAVWENTSLSDQQRRGVVTLDEAGCVLEFVEKPSKPTSMLAAAPYLCTPCQIL